MLQKNIHRQFPTKYWNRYQSNKIEILWGDWSVAAGTYKVSLGWLTTKIKIESQQETHLYKHLDDDDVNIHAIWLKL